MSLIARIGFTAAMIVAVTAAHAQQVIPQQFALPGHGQLQMAVPNSWRSEVHEPSRPLPPTFTFKPAAGAPFMVVVTPIWPVGDMKALPGIDAMREQVAAAADHLAPQAVEKALPLHELAGAAGRGFYFVATDRAPNPGEFKYLAQGIVNLGDINLAFTVLTNDGQESVLKAALGMVRGAKHAS